LSDTSGGIPIQFDTAVPQPGHADGAALVCKNCSQPIISAYYDVSGHSVCAECRTKIGAIMETPTGVAPLVKAGLFGLGAGIAGAIVYYAVLALLNLEIGIVAILIGYMVGYAVRKGAGGGGRRFQVMAVALTYAAVGLAYTPIVFKAADDHRNQAAQQATDSASAAAPAETSASKTRVNPLIAILSLLGFIAVLPVLIVFGSLPSGIISGAIISFGMMQAWKMTRTPALTITGPYRVGAAQAASA
jgi:hypothetical protein